MKRVSTIAAAALNILAATSFANAGEAPQIVWDIPTPNSLANSVLGVGFAPAGPANVVVGSTDRWTRVRRANDGGLLYSVLQPHRSGGADQTVYSADGLHIAVHNQSGGLGFRVYRGSDGLFEGEIAVSIDSADIVHFTPTARFPGNNGAVSAWRPEELTVVRSVGSGYDRVVTVFNFSPNGALQSAASKGSIRIERRSDGSLVRVISGNAPVAFAPDSARIAAKTASPNGAALFRIGDGVLLKRFPAKAANEGLGAIRFTRDGGRLVTTGYLPYVDSDGLWQQVGLIRFWRVADGVLQHEYDQRTGIAVTSPVAWSPNGSRFIFGTYDGAVKEAVTPPP